MSSERLNLITREEILLELKTEDLKYEKEVMRLCKLLGKTFKVGDRLKYYTRLVDITDIITLTGGVSVGFKCVDTGTIGWLPIRDFVKGLPVADNEEGVIYFKK